MKFFLLGMILSLSLNLQAKLVFEDADLASERHEGLVPEAECTDVDVRETNPKIRDNPRIKELFSTPRNQDSIGWCYAFTAADLLSVELGSPVSSTHMGMLMNKTLQLDPKWRAEMEASREKIKSALKTVFESGWPALALQAAVKNGAICSEEALPFDSKYPRETYLFIEQLEKDKKLAHSQEEIICQEIKIFLPDLNSSQEDLRKLAKSLATQNLNLSLEDLAAAKCKDSMLTVSPLDIKTIALWKQPRADQINGMKWINYVLNKGQPLGITYDTSFITGKSGSHASVILGRRWKDGECQYLIRNSWGKSCAAYKNGIDCNKEEGTYWMSGDNFNENVYEVEYVSH